MCTNLKTGGNKYFFFLLAILKNADLTKTSAKKVRQQLEEKLDVDLADQKKVVDELVMEVLKDKKGGDKGKKKKDDSDDDGVIFLS